MAQKPNPEMDERVTIPLDPETALRGLLHVDPTKIDNEDTERESADPPRKPQK